MNRLYIAISAMLMTGIANAFPLLNSMEPLPNVSAGQCTDFSGTYRGKCTFQGHDFNENVKLEQSGCEAFRINGMDVPIGSLIGVSVAQPGLAGKAGRGDNRSVSFVWSKDRKTIQLSGGILSQRLGATEASALPSVVSGDMRVEGRTLLIQVKAKAFGEEKAKDYASCEYTKQ